MRIDNQQIEIDINGYTFDAIVTFGYQPYVAPIHSPHPEECEHGAEEEINLFTLVVNTQNRSHNLSAILPLIESDIIEKIRSNNA